MCGCSDRESASNVRQLQAEFLIDLTQQGRFKCLTRLDLSARQVEAVAAGGAHR
jgi:hypothetical protein